MYDFPHFTSKHVHEFLHYYIRIVIGLVIRSDTAHFGTFYIFILKRITSMPSFMSIKFSKSPVLFIIFRRTKTKLNGIDLKK